MSDLAQTFNLRRRPYGGKKRLGDELIDTAAAAIVNRTKTRQLDSAGKPLKPLKSKYKAAKVRKGYDPRILVKTGEMLELEQVRGKTVVTANVASMEAGLDGEVKALVEYAHEGSKNRPKRPFYDLGKDGEAAVDTLANETIDAAIKAALGA